MVRGGFIDLAVLTVEFFFSKLKKTNLNEEDLESAEGKVVIVTGGNAGIGKALSKEFALRGARVIMACRNVEKGKEAAKEIQKDLKNAQLDVVRLDIADFESIKTFVVNVNKKYEKVNLLVNNAGIMLSSNVVKKNNLGFELHMATHFFGPFILTNLLLPILKKGNSSRIINIASSYGRLGNLNLNDINSDNIRDFGIFNCQLYANSKLAEAYFGYELGKKLEKSGIGVYSMCPGLVKSDLFQDFPPHLAILHKIDLALLGTSPAKACETILLCSLSKSLANESGKFYRNCKQWTKMTKCMNDQTSENLWNLAENLCKDFASSYEF